MSGNEGSCFRFLSGDTLQSSFAAFENFAEFFRNHILFRTGKIPGGCMPASSAVECPEISSRFTVAADEMQFRIQKKKIPCRQLITPSLSLLSPRRFSSSLLRSVMPYIMDAFAVVPSTSITGHVRNVVDAAVFRAGELPAVRLVRLDNAACTDRTCRLPAV